jgi:hypothetical protein
MEENTQIEQFQNLGEEQLQAVTGAGLPEPKESVSPITYNRWRADQHQALAMDAYHNGLLDKANEHIALSLDLHKIADQYELEKIDGKKPMPPKVKAPKTRNQGISING